MGHGAVQHERRNAGRPGEGHKSAFSAASGMRILLADGEAVVRWALRVALSQVPGTEIVGEAMNAEQVMCCVAQNHPNIMLLSWELPGRGPEALLAGARALVPGLRIIALSAQPEARKAALEAGADAYVSKVEPPEKLLAALRACMEHSE